jgi:uncharacterized membrane protein
LNLEHLLKSTTAGLVTQFLPGQVSPGRPAALSMPVVGGVARRSQRSDYTRESESLEQVREAVVAQGDVNVQLQREAEDIYAGWRDLTSEQKFNEYLQVKAENPRVAKRIDSLLEDEKLGLGYEDRIMKRLQVQNGARARYILTHLNEIEDPEEKFDYWQNLEQKKLISEMVGKQIRVLLSIQTGQ